MPALRTSLVALAVGGAAVTTGIVATSATAAPAPVAAVDAVSAGVATDDAAPQARIQPGRAWWKKLSDTQQQCLEDAKITRPVGPLDDAQRTALREQVTAAAGKCGVELPFPKARAFWNDLSDTQKQCLDDANVTRPWGKLTKEQRQAVRADLKAAAEKCGVTLPEKPANPSPAPSASPSAT
jgi:Spy/CpxP family protein refolding chaperone